MVWLINLIKFITIRIGLIGLVTKLQYARMLSYHLLVNCIQGHSLSVYELYWLAGTRQTFKTGVKTLKGRISFLPLSLQVKIIITYLIRVFDTTWCQNFEH